MVKLLIRAAALLSIIFAAGHTYGTLTIAYGDTQPALNAQLILVEGIEKSYADLFLGYGYLITALLAAQGLILWMLASIDGPQARNLLAVIGLASAANAAFSALYLIIVPVIFSGIIAALLIVAWLRIGQKNA